MSQGADNFASATEVVIATNGGTYASDPTPNAGFTGETGETQPTGYSSGLSAWWRYTPLTSGTATFSTAGTVNTGAGTDTEMGVYTGSSLGSLTLVGSDSDSGPGATSVVTMSVTAGVTYYATVRAYSDAHMSYVLSVTGPASASGPTSYATGAVFAASSASSVGAVAQHSTGMSADAVSGFTVGSNAPPASYATGMVAAASSGVVIGTDGSINPEEPDPAAEYAPELPAPTLPPVVTPGRVLVSVATSLPAPVLVDGRPQ